MSVINITNLSKKYRNLVVFNDLTITFVSGDMIFLVGNNGSGKSTFIKCLLKLIKYEGNVEDQNISYSYCPEKLIFPDYLTIGDFLSLFGKVKNIDKESLSVKLDYYYNKFNLREHLDKYLIKLSKGTKQKLLIILTLMVDADVYIFDEPLNGLDRTTRRTFYEELRKLHQTSKIVIISTHHLSSYRFKNRKVIDFNNL